MSEVEGPSDQKEQESPAEDELVMARRYHLGAIVEASATMEMTLRAIFAALLGTPRAAVVAGGQPVRWLVDNCVAMIETNDEVRGPSLGDPEKVARFRAAIQRCGELYGKRNQLLHGAWLEGGPNFSQAISRWRKPRSIWVEVQMDELDGLCRELNDAVNELMASIYEVKGIISGT